MICGLFAGGAFAIDQIDRPARGGSISLIGQTTWAVVIFAIFALRRWHGPYARRTPTDLPPGAHVRQRRLRDAVRST